MPLSRTSVNFLISYAPFRTASLFCLVFQSIGSLDKGIFCSIMHITDHFLLSTVQMLDRQESLLWSWFSVRDQLAKHVKLQLNAANLYAKKHKGTRHGHHLQEEWPSQLSSLSLNFCSTFKAVKVASEHN